MTTTEALETIKTLQRLRRERLQVTEDDKYALGICAPFVLAGFGLLAFACYIMWGIPN